MRIVALFDPASSLLCHMCAVAAVSKKVAIWLRGVSGPAGAHTKGPSVAQACGVRRH